MGLRIVGRTDDIGIVRGIAVVDDTFLMMDEVTRCLVRHHFVGIASAQGIGARRRPVALLVSRIAKALVGHGLIAHLLIILREDHIRHVGIDDRHAVFVLGIDEATTHLVLLHVDQVQFDDTRHVSIVLVVFRAVLGGQLQEHT